MERQESRSDVLVVIEDESIRRQVFSVLTGSGLSFEEPPTEWTPDEFVSRIHSPVILFDSAAMQSVHSRPAAEHPVLTRKILWGKESFEQQLEVCIYVILTSSAHRDQLESKCGGCYNYIVYDSGFDTNLSLLLNQAVRNARLQEEIINGKLKYNFLKESVQDIIWMADSDGRITFITDSVRLMLDFSPEEVEGRSLEELFTTDSGNMIRDAIRQALEGLRRNPNLTPGSRVLELEQLRRDGSRLWTEISMNFFPDHRGGLKMVSGVMRNLTERKRAETNLIRTFEKYREALEGIVVAMGKIVEIRDPYTAGHQQRVTRMACDIAGIMGLSGIQLEALRFAGSLHDLGKISIPTEILTRPGKLRDAEVKIIRSHPRVGFEILHSITFPWPIARIVLSHHERMNGSGYPEGLSGEAIPLESRILAVADVVEAMTAYRPYRPAAFTPEEAVADVVNNAGELFDRDVVAAFQNLLQQKGDLYFEKK